MKYFVLFGASGDLAKTKLFPALFENYKEEQAYKYIGYGRTPLSDSQFRESVKDSIEENNEKYLSNFSYIQGVYKAEDLVKLKDLIDPKEATFYLAIPNRFNIVKELVQGLKENDLIQDGTTLVLEKPFGEDYNSAKQLTDFLKREVGEEKALLAVGHMKNSRVVPLDETLAFAAADVALKENLAMADAIIVASARAHDCTIITSDADLKHQANVRYLPKN